MNRLFSLGLLSYLTFFGPTDIFASPIVVDTFDTPGAVYAKQGQATHPVPPSDAGSGSISHSGAGILGTRDFSYLKTPAGLLDVGDAVVLGNGKLIVASGASGSAISVTLKYSGFGTIDVSSFTSLDLEFIPLFDDGTGVFNIDVTLKDSLNDTRSTSFPAPGSLQPGGGTLSIPLASLIGTGDLGSVAEILISLNDGMSSSPAADYSLTSISFANPVPEPASFALWALVGITGIALRRRRLQANQS